MFREILDSARFNLQPLAMVAVLFTSIGQAKVLGAEAVFSGQVLDAERVPLCAIVLINGQYTFSCDGDGGFRLTAPLAESGDAVMFVFADGYQPYRASLGAEQIGSAVEAQLHLATSGVIPRLDVELTPLGEASPQLLLSGFVRTPTGAPMCAMVLANGSYAFSCDGRGGFEFAVPQGPGGGANVFVFADGWLPLKHYVPGEARELGCDGFFEVKVAQGLLNNNVWNPAPAAGFPWRQCILKRGEGAHAQYGWSWSWPEVSQAVYSYPAVVMGKKPWFGGPTTREDLPIKIGDIESMIVDFELDTESDGEFNLAISLWITQTGVVTDEPYPEDIVTELMVWTNYDGMIAVTPLRGSLALGDLVFDVHYAPNWLDASGVNSNRWALLGYHIKAPQRTNQLRLNLRAFLDDAIARGYVSVDQFVSSVEVGNELQAGSGTSWIKSLSLSVNERAHVPQE